MEKIVDYNVYLTEAQESVDYIARAVDWLLSSDKTDGQEARMHVMKYAALMADGALRRLDNILNDCPVDAPELE